MPEFDAPTAGAVPTALPLLEPELVAALEGWGVDAAHLADRGASLIRSGLLDSLALFNLSMWLEDKLGGPIDPTTFDVAQEWDSIESILRFLEARAAPGCAASAPAALLSATPVPASGMRRRRGAHYEIVRFTGQFLSEVAQLLCGLWSPHPAANEAVFRWKYEDNPFAADPLVYLALRDGKPVAMRGFCGSRWEGGGAAEPMLLYTADDLVVAEADRNHGLFSRFTQAAIEDLRARGHGCFLSLSALRVTRLQSLATGSRAIGMMSAVALQPGWVAVLDGVTRSIEGVPLLWRAAQRLSIGRSAQASFRKMDAAGGAHARDGVRVEIAPQAEPNAMAGLVARLGHDGRIRHLRDRRFFEWRFRHPLHEYRFLYGRRAGRLAGYLVLQRGLSPYFNQRRVNMVDWACEDDELLCSLIEVARRTGCFAELVGWRDGMPEASDRLGFVPHDAHQAERGLPCILLRETGDEPAADALQRIGLAPLLDFGRWDLRMAYTSYG